MRFKKRISREEITTRLKYYDPKNNFGLIGGQLCESDEIISNPDIIGVLKTIRRKDKKRAITITTNGTSLSADMVKKLSNVRPIIVVLSLNSSTPKTRGWLMNDQHPEIAINSLPLLKRHKIPFILSIVVWPGLSFADIEKTILFAEKNDAVAIRLIFPGYSKFFSKKKLFDINKKRMEIAKHFHPLFKNFSIPVYFVPNMLVQNLLLNNIDIPIIIGVIKNSPSFNRGIKPNDVIKEINGRSVNSIEDALKQLSRFLNKSIILKVKRGGAILEFFLAGERKDVYPYCTETLKKNAPFGILLAERYLSADDVKDIGRYIDVHRAKNVMVLSSATARPFLLRLLNKLNIAKDYNVNIRVVTAKNYFYGGCIDSGDLLTVGDYIKSIKDNLKKFKPDLIILPASPFTNWGRDLAGRINLDIERIIKIPVEFIYNSKLETIY